MATRDARIESGSKQIGQPAGSNRALRSRCKHTRSGELSAYFWNHTVGPGLWKWSHYFDIYEQHLSHFKCAAVPPRVLEMGIYSGGSMKMWRWYFGPRAMIYGLDISPATKVYERNESYGAPDAIFVGSQGDPNVWQKVEATEKQLDIILDDAAHTPQLQIAALKLAFRLLAPGGVYLVEDLSMDTRFSTYVLSHFVTDGVMHYKPFQRIVSDREKETGMDMKAPLRHNSPASAVEHVTFHPGVVAITKRYVPLGSVASYRHGTAWRPPEFWNGQAFG